MATNIGPKIGIEGEQEYKKQIKSIINDVKVLKTETDALTSSYEKEKKSIAQNKREKELLEKTIEATSKKLKVQEEMLMASATALDENGQHTDEMAEKTKEWQAIVNSTQAELEKYKRQLDEMPSSIELIGQKLKDAGEKMKDFGDKMKDIGGKLTTTVTAPIVGLATAGIAFNAQMEQYQVAFTTLTGSAEEADRIISNLQEDASKSPFDTASLIEANQYLISAGVDADKARQDILNLGNAISATGGGSAELSRMAQNLQQIKNTGKATSQDIKQFANAGINIYGLLADYTGKTTEEVKDMEVSYEVLSGALAKASEEGGRYYGAMENQSQTLNGQLSTLKDSVGQVLGSLTESLVPVIMNILNKVNEFINYLKTLDPEQKKMILTIAGIVASIGPLLSVIGTLITVMGSAMTIVGQLGISLGAFLGPVALVVAGIVGLILIITNWGAISEWLKTTWDKAVNFLVEKFTSLKTNAINLFENMRQGISNTASRISDAIKNGINNAINWIKSLPSQALRWGADMINSFAQGIRNAIGNVVGAVKSIANTVTSWLHFSEPDVGPLSNFHTWMPDMMKGLASGINDNMYLVEDAMSNLAGAMSMGSSNSVNYGGVVINLNVPQGANGQQLVSEIENELAQRTIRRKAVFG